MVNERITERHVQAIWYDMTLRPRRLLTHCGNEVRVVSPGEWNLEAGPDFTNAVLEIGPNRRRVIGDVEVHLCPSDWDFHGHGTDPRYRNVVAHVTWKDGSVPRTLPPDAVSIWIGRLVSENPSFSPLGIDVLAYPQAKLPLDVRPCEKAIGGDPDLARKVLSEAGWHRLSMKARRIEGLLCASGGAREQVFYEEVMTALGYGRNAVSFRRLARRVPLAELPSDVSAARRALQVAGGFEVWERGGVRPFNAPERRLAAAASVFRETPILSLDQVDDVSPTACQTILSSLCAGSHLGRGRAAAILANVIVPFALAERRLSALPAWLPPEDISAPVRLTASRLLGRDHNPAAFYATNGLLIQGLLQIRRDRCLPAYPDCETCALSTRRDW